MSDTPCVDGCGQDAATIERLREERDDLQAELDAVGRGLARSNEAVAGLEAERDALEATVARVEALADRWQREEMPDPTTADIDLRAALAPQNAPQSAASAPEAPGQPGMGEEGSGGESDTATVTLTPDVTDLLAALQRSINDAKARRLGR